MSWLSRLEKNFGHLAIHGLLRYVAAFSSLCFILFKIQPGDEFQPGYLDFLWLDWNRVMQGEVWRLFTYIFIPSVGGFFPDWLGMAFYVLFLFWVGDGLERAWGEFRLNVFFFLGMLGTTIGAFITRGNPGGGGLLHMTVFLAFARFYPEEWIRLFLLIPVKVKWLAWFDVALLLYFFITGTISMRAAIMVSFLNYFVFFGRDLIREIKTHGEIRERRARFTRAVAEGTSETMHRCHICGVTEQTSPEMEFRVSDDGEEYCVQHLPKRTSAAS